MIIRLVSFSYYLFCVLSLRKVHVCEFGQTEFEVNMKPITQNLIVMFQVNRFCSHHQYASHLMRYQTLYELKMFIIDYLIGSTLNYRPL